MPPAISIALRQSQMDIFDFILLPRDRFYGGMGVWYYLPCGTGGGFPLSLASHDSGSVLAVKEPRSGLTCPGAVAIRVLVPVIYSQ